MTPEFLSVEDVLDLHAGQLDRFGGATGVRDFGLLESAVAQPQAMFGGEFLHADLFAMAAAYLFHLVSNHPFMDGNKRTGLLAALVFLDLNGITLDYGSDDLYSVTMAVASGRMPKTQVAEELRRIVCSR